MARARHGRIRSAWATVVVAVVVVVLVGGAAFATVRLAGSGNAAAAPPTTPPTVPPATTGPTTKPTTPGSSPSVQPSPSAEASPSVGPSPSVEPSSVPTTGPTTEPSPSPGTPSPKPTLGTLRPGMAGPNVLDLQRQLRSLGYWLGTPDGSYGDATTQAVMAFQGWEGLDRDGVAGPITRHRLAHAEAPAPRDPSTDQIEIDKQHQVILVVRDGVAKYVFHTSTGFDGAYTDPDGNPQVADTPEGHWTFLWAVDGWRDGDLGMLYRPRYFHPTGVAIHGYGNVPGYPASHGCARVSFEAINFIWAQDLAPLKSKVWVY